MGSLAPVTGSLRQRDGCRAGGVEMFFSLKQVTLSSLLIRSWQFHSSAVQCVRSAGSSQTEGDDISYISLKALLRAAVSRWLSLSESDGLAPPAGDHRNEGIQRCSREACSCDRERRVQVLEMNIRVSSELERGVFERGVSERGVLERGVLERGVLERGVLERGVSERGVFERGVLERGVLERGVLERGVSERGVSERGVSERGVSERGVFERECVERGRVPRGRGGGAVGERRVPQCKSRV
ncbi:hypothetical protein NFI96_008765 [Prochilodus magdalenae]|nr:hypothetical protein NFI96_008765 [Prochilodus magdalenae]